MNYRKIGQDLLLREALLRALHCFAMSIAAGPTRYENAMFWQFEYLYLWDKLDAIETRQTNKAIFKLALMCKGYPVGEDK